LMESMYREFVEKNSNNSKNEKTLLYLLIQAYVFSDFGISVNDMAKITEISERTIRRLISDFKKKGMLTEEKYGKVIYYNLSKTNI